MSNEESAFEPGPEAEEALGPDDVHAEADDEAYTAAGYEAGPAEQESQQQDSRTP